MASLKVLKKLGQIFIVSPFQLEEMEISFYQEFCFRNFIFFKRHFAEDFPEYLKFLHTKLRDLKFLCVDQEGGRVVRIPGEFESPLTAAKGRAEKVDGAFLNWAKGLARSVKEAGLNVNLAPCVDLADETAPDFLRERTFSKDPAQVIECAKLFLQAHKELNIQCCLKHFPGLGEVETDPHENLPTQEELSREALLPFKELAGLYSLVMTTHLVVKKLSPQPATFSEKTITLLRRDCQFQGLILTDDLSMSALGSYDLVERFVLALASGHNLLLYCGPLAPFISSFEELILEIKGSKVLKERLEESYLRQENFFYL